MIGIVQVYPYEGNSGCSVRVGKGIDHTILLQPNNCRGHYFDFVETEQEVREAINFLKKLPKHFRMRDEGIDKLKQYLTIVKFKTRRSRSL